MSAVNITVRDAPGQIRSGPPYYPGLIRFPTHPSRALGTVGAGD